MTQITEDMKTDWFPSSIDPVHMGHYETRWAPDDASDDASGDASGDFEMRQYVGNGLWRVKDTYGVWIDSLFGTAGGRLLAAEGEAWRGLKQPIR